MNTKRKKIIIPIILVLLIAVGVFTAWKLGWIFHKNDDDGLYSEMNLFVDTEGNDLYIDDTDDDSTDNSQIDLNKEYMKSIDFEILEIDKKSNTAMVEVSIPEIANAVTKIVADVMSKNDDIEIEELKTLVQSEMKNYLNSDEIEKTTTQLEFDVLKKGKEYKLIMNDDFEYLIIGQLEDAAVKMFREMIGAMTDESFN